jgi:hypothetical protein
MRVRANGGATFIVDSDAYEWVRFKVSGGHLIDTSIGAHLTMGGAWTNGSSRDLKEHFAPVTGTEVLARLADVPIQTWNYKAEDPSIRRMGPVAQDFYAAFGLGEGEEQMSTVDADGVALAAIQGLYELSQERRAAIEGLEAENAELRARVDDLETRLEALEQTLGTPENPESSSAASSSPVRGSILSGTALLVMVAAVTWGARRKGNLR